MTPGAKSEGGVQQEGSARDWRVWPLLIALACCVAFYAPPMLAAAAATPAATQDPGYPAQRDQLRAEIEQLGRKGPKAAQLAAMARLQALAEAHGDMDLAHLMQAERIFAVHDDASIDASLAELNAVLGKVGPDASVELQEALERIYGNLYFDAGNFNLSLDHQLKALQLTERLPRGGQQARLYRLSIISELYNAMELPEQALRHADEGLLLAGKHVELAGSRLSLLAARAMALMQLGRHDEAARALDQAKRIDAGREPGFNSMRLAGNIATLQIAMGQTEQALVTIRGMQAMATQQDSNYYRTRARLLQGQAWVSQGRVADGLVEMRSAIAEFERLGQMIDVLDGLGREIDVLRARQSWPEAMASMQRKLSLWSDLHRQGQSRAVAEIDAVHRAQLRDRQIAALAAEVDLERARARSEQLRMALAVALALFAISVAALLYMSRRRTRSERDRLSQVVRHDPLTGAYSRYEFQRRFHEPSSGAAGTGTRHLLLLDLDEFKSINDRHGHECGDVVLKSVVARLDAAMGKGDELYRWGGEEFLLVMAERDAATLRRDVIRLLDAVAAQPHHFDGMQLPVTLSGGLSRHPPGTARDVPPADAIRWADAALYAAKLAGRNCVIHAQLTESGATELHGHRPIDVAQLQDWQRQGLVALETIRPDAAGSPTAVHLVHARRA